MGGAGAGSALVIGAGVVGVATAYALARRGVAVTLVEAADGPGRGSSFANGAQLSYGYTDALASPALLKRLPAILLGADPAFQVSRRLDPAFLRWSLAFLRNGSEARFRANTLAGLTLALESRLAMADLLERHPLDFAHEGPGKLLLFENQGALRRAAALAELKVAAGAEQQVVSVGRALAIEPALRSATGRLAGAIWAPREEVGDPHLFCVGLTRVLEQSYGVSLRFGKAVRALVTGARPGAILEDGERLEADELVLCTGADARALLRPLGLEVPVMPVRGHSLTLPAGPEPPRVSITDTARKLVFCLLSGAIRLAGQADVGFSGRQVQQRRIEALLQAARESLPHAADYARPLSAWAGLRPVTPTSLPLIEQRAGLTLNLGHGALGWTYAMGAAERAARLVSGSRTIME